MKKERASTTIAAVAATILLTSIPNASADSVPRAPYGINKLRGRSLENSLWSIQPSSNLGKGACSIDNPGDVSTIAQAISSDPTGISVDISSDPASCWRFTLENCLYDIRKVKEISFDAIVDNCADVWSSPLWQTPSAENAWIPPQRDTGEIDFLEYCHEAPNLSFGSQSGDYGTWGFEDKNHVDGRFQLQFIHAQDGVQSSIQSRFCPEKNCDNILWRTSADGIPASDGYFERLAEGIANNPAISDENGYSMGMVSDVWNAGSDATYQNYCAQGSNSNSACKYQVGNIQFTFFDDGDKFTGECAALNAQRTIPLKYAVK